MTGKRSSAVWVIYFCNGLELAKPSLEIERQDDGSLILKSGIELQDYPAALGHHLIHWAATNPDNNFLSERDEAGTWQKCSYSASLKIVEAIAQFLLDQNFHADTPLMILSENSLEHAFLTFGTIHIGVPVVPVTPAYSLVSQDHAKLKYIFNLVRPRMIYTADGAAFQKAIASLDTNGVKLAVKKNPDTLGDAVTFDHIVSTRPTPAVVEVFSRITPDTIAKILFTSGSTGMPKGALNTQRMLCSNQQALGQTWPFLKTTPPVLVEWLPWSHFNKDHPASSIRIDRVKIMTRLPGIDANEITDKGYINQRAVVENRSNEIEALYAGRDGAIIIG